MYGDQNVMRTSAAHLTRLLKAVADVEHLVSTSRRTVAEARHLLEQFERPDPAGNQSTTHLMATYGSVPPKYFADDRLRRLRLPAGAGAAV